MEMRKVRSKGGLDLSRFLFLLLFLSLSAGERTQEALYSSQASVEADDVNNPVLGSARDAFHLRGHATGDFHEEVTWSRISPNDVDTGARGEHGQVHYKLRF